MELHVAMGPLWFAPIVLAFLTAVAATMVLALASGRRLFGAAAPEHGPGLPAFMGGIAIIVAFVAAAAVTGMRTDARDLAFMMALMFAVGFWSSVAHTREGVELAVQVIAVGLLARLGDVEVRTLAHAVHSGMWGGLVPDAIMALTRLLATLWTEDGSPAVDGLTGSAAADVDYPEERLRAESGAAPGTRWIGAGSAVERLWARPAITVTGIDVPKVDGASNTLVPVARARVTIRLAPGDTSANAIARLQEHLDKHVPWGARLTTTVVDACEPTVLPTAGPAYAAARSALAEAWGVAPVDMGCGGSIPFIAEFQEALPGASILVTGVEDPDTRAHGPNEGLHLPEFERAVPAEALLLRRLGEAGDSPPGS